jgi:hydrogenase maturation protease
MDTLVLGLGNELFGDDAVGIHVVRKIKCECEGRKDVSGLIGDVDFEECSVTGLAILDYIIGYDDVIIIDTIKKAKPTTGKISVLREKDLRHVPGPSPHYISIPQAVEIGKKIKQKVPSKIDIIAVEAKDLYRVGEGLTEEMAEALPAIIDTLFGLLKERQ